MLLWGVCLLNQLGSNVSANIWDDPTCTPIASTRVYADRCGSDPKPTTYYGSPANYARSAGPRERSHRHHKREDERSQIRARRLTMACPTVTRFVPVNESSESVPRSAVQKPKCTTPLTRSSSDFAGLQPHTVRPFAHSSPSCMLHVPLTRIQTLLTCVALSTSPWASTGRNEAMRVPSAILWDDVAASCSASAA